VRSLDEFPPHVRALVEAADPASPVEWANRKIPALAGRTVFELLDHEGPEAVAAFARKVIGKFS
jgi:hypothetical protein